MPVVLDVEDGSLRFSGRGGNAITLFIDDGFIQQIMCDCRIEGAHVSMALYPEHSIVQDDALVCLNREHEEVLRVALTPDIRAKLSALTDRDD